MRRRWRPSIHDAVIAGILNRQGRTTAYGHRFEAVRVASLRRHWDIPCFEPSATHAEGELLTIKKAAAALEASPPRPSIACSTLGSSRASKLTPSSPRGAVRLTDDVMARFNNDAGEGFIPMREAMKALGVLTPKPYCSVSSAAGTRRRPCYARKAKKDSVSKR